MAGIPRRCHGRRRANRLPGRIHAIRAPDLTPPTAESRIAEFGPPFPSQAGIRVPDGRICAPMPRPRRMRVVTGIGYPYTHAYLCRHVLFPCPRRGTRQRPASHYVSRRPCRASSWPAAGHLDPALERLPCACRAVQADLRTPAIATAESGMISGNHRPAGSLRAAAQGRPGRPTHPLAMNAVTLGLR